MNEDTRKTCEEENDIGCTETCYSDISIGIPVTIKPFGKIGNAKTQCLESSVVFDKEADCARNTDNYCRLIITQKLRVEIPVVFGANVEAADAFIDCPCNHHCNCTDDINVFDDN